MDADNHSPAAAIVSLAFPVVLAVVSVSGALFTLRRPVVRRPRVKAAEATMASPVEVVGRGVRLALGRERNPPLDRQLGRALLIASMFGVVALEFGVVSFLTIRSASVLRRRRVAQQRADRVSAGLADVIDLLAVALLSGNTVGAATRQVIEWADGEYADAFRWCERQVAQGRTLSDALEMLPTRLGPQVQPLVAALVATERYGSPIAQSLTQLAADSRADRRRRAEAVARRLPVTMLFPLVVCVLPAFLLLTVVPVLGEAVRSFDFAASP